MRLILNILSQKNFEKSYLKLSIILFKYEKLSTIYRFCYKTNVETRFLLSYFFQTSLQKTTSCRNQ